MNQRNDSDSSRHDDTSSANDDAKSPEDVVMEKSEEGASREESDEPAPLESDEGVPGENEAPRRAPLNAAGMERPKFLLDFPVDPSLEPLIEAFEAGNYSFVRRHADDVASAASDPEVRSAALELRRRIEPDPLAKYLLALSIGLFVFVVLWTYLGHDH